MSRVERHTADMPTRSIADIILGDSRPPEEIVMAEPGVLSNDYADAIAFGEEFVTIRIERSSEPNAPQMLDFYVNGIAHWVPVGVPHTLRRKYVEVIARSQPYSVTADYTENSGQDPVNRISRNATARYPFSVVKDTPRGHEWLAQVMRES